MYISIVADNIADRKQAERLLERANTALSTQLGTLYISAFGDETAFLRACIRFDLFLLDFDHDPEHSLSIAEKLKEMNAPGIPVLVLSEDEPVPEKAADCRILRKPLLTAPLHELIGQVHEEVTRRRSEMHLVELRGEKETLYIPKDDIIYIEIDEKKHDLIYHIKDRDPFPLSGNLSDLVRSVGNYPEFEIKLKNVVINTRYILKEDKKSILLTGGECFSRSLFWQIFS